jgi:hypothetical protein
MTARDTQAQIDTLQLIVTGMLLDQALSSTSAGDYRRDQILNLARALVPDLEAAAKRDPSRETIVSTLRDNIQIIADGEELRDPDPWPSVPAWIRADDGRVALLLGLPIQALQADPDQRTRPQNVGALDTIDDQDLHTLDDADTHHVLARAEWLVRPACAG